MDPRSANSSDDELDDGLYNEFEQACASVSTLFKQPTWRNFQTGAVHTTQLYKAGSEAAKRAFDKGLQKGRLQLAKELLALKRYGSKIDAHELYQVLHKYALLPSDHPMSPRQRRFPPTDLSNGVNQAVSMFQQALNPPNTSPNSSLSLSPAELNAFLHNQVLRHRKRAHSPMDSCGIQSNQHILKRKRF